jgi:hypothetical protein
MYVHLVSRAANLTRILYIDRSIANEISVVLCFVCSVLQIFLFY